MIAALGSAIQSRLLACPICFGDPNSKQVHGARIAVLFLLAVTLAMLSTIACVAHTWARRARQLG